MVPSRRLASVEIRAPMPSPIAETLRILMDEFEVIAESLEEFTDTIVLDVRHCVLTYYLVWGQTDLPLRQSFDMYSPEADALVRSVLERFITVACAIADSAGIPVGVARFAMLQDWSVSTRDGHQIDLYIGARDTPLALDEVRRYLIE
jgi:hypothetical protein